MRNHRDGQPGDAVRPMFVVTCILATFVASAGDADPAKHPSATNTFGQPIVWTNGLADQPGEAEEIKLATDDPLSRSPAISGLLAFTNILFEEWPHETDTHATRRFSVTAPVAVKRPAVRANSFWFGTPVPLSNRVTQVTINLDKGFRLRVAGCWVGLHEVRLTFTNGVVKRTSLLYAGRTTFRTPLSVEGVEVSGVLLIFAFLSVTGLLWHASSRKHVEPSAPPNRGPAERLENSGGGGGPPSVS